MSLSKPWSSVRDEWLRPRNSKVIPLQHQNTFTQLAKRIKNTTYMMAPNPEGLNEEKSENPKPAKKCSKWSTIISGIIGKLSGFNPICDMEMCLSAFWQKIISGWKAQPDWDKNTSKCIIYVSLFVLVIGFLVGAILYFVGGDVNFILTDVVDLFLWVLNTFKLALRNLYGLLFWAARKGYELVELMTERTGSHPVFPFTAAGLALVWLIEDIASEFLGNMRVWEDSIFAKCYRFFDFPFKVIENFAGQLLGDFGYIIAWLLLIPFNVAALALGLFTGSIIFPFQILFDGKTH